jgi:hypothetical protein
VGVSLHSALTAKKVAIFQQFTRGEPMLQRSIRFITAIFLGMVSAAASGWDHPGHMTSAAIAFIDIKQARPDLIEKLGLLFLAHPDPAPFWVAAGEARGEERTRRMFLECARWPDDSKFTNNDRLSWHTARWPLLAEDAPPEAKKAVAARNGRPIGQGIEGMALNFAMLRNHEATPMELAWSLCWVMHILGDIHQPWHVTELYSAEFPTGNAAASLSYVDDPLTDTTIPLHILWDSNYLRTPSLEAVDKAAAEFRKNNPRSSYPELQSHPIDSPNFFRQWTKESHQVAVDWAADIESVRDLESSQDADTLVKNMVNFILNGVSPVAEAPEVPDEYWKKLKHTSQRRLTLAGYRIADLVIAAADDIEAQREFIGY